MQRLPDILILFWVAVASLGLAWEESCGNPVLFCYLVSREILVRRGGSVPIASPLAAPFTVHTKCSNQSAAFSTLSTTSRG
jgi:hypothetical protein